MDNTSMRRYENLENTVIKQVWTKAQHKNSEDVAKFKYLKT
jgi:hypothetical protein